MGRHVGRILSELDLFSTIFAWDLRDSYCSLDSTYVQKGRVGRQSDVPEGVFGTHGKGRVVRTSRKVSRRSFGPVAVMDGSF